MRIKNVLKSFGIGLIYLVNSYTIYKTFFAMLDAFSSMTACTGALAVFFFLSGLTFALLCVLLICFSGFIALVGLEPSCVQDRSEDKK